MKISSNITRLIGELPTSHRADAVAGTAQPNEHAAVLGGDRIGASGPGDFDAAKVERVRSAMAAGNYQVNPEVIADGLLADALAFL